MFKKYTLGRYRIILFPVLTTRKLRAPDGMHPTVDAHYLLPEDRVRYVGEAVAMVVAESLQQAMDAVEAVIVDYFVLPHITESKDAILPDGPSYMSILKTMF